MAFQADNDRSVQPQPQVDQRRVSDSVEAERHVFSVVRRAVERTRLMVEGGGAVSAADVSSKLNSALTEFGKGELVVAAALVQNAAISYQEKLNRWDGLARQREESVKQRSMQKYRQVLTVHNPIRINSRQILGNFRHLSDLLSDKVKKECGISDSKK